jgi:hypothetical protein
MKYESQRRDAVPSAFVVSFVSLCRCIGRGRRQANRSMEKGEGSKVAAMQRSLPETSGNSPQSERGQSVPSFTPLRRKCLQPLTAKQRSEGDVNAQEAEVHEGRTPLSPAVRIRDAQSRNEKPIMNTFDQKGQTKLKQ